MTIISDLPWELVVEILSRVSITTLRTVRSTCKRWNTLSKDESFMKKHCGKASMEFLLSIISDEDYDDKSPTRFTLCDIKDLPSTKEIGKMLNTVKISKVFQCDGLLLLLVTTDNLGLVIWNPYLAKSRWIEPRNNYHKSDWYAIGYDDKNNHKVLRVFYEFDHSVKHEIYNVKSNSWRALDIDITYTNNYYISIQGVSLKGNTYFLAQDKRVFLTYVVLCFDFTTERFELPLHLPFDVRFHDVLLSWVREEHLAVYSMGGSIMATYEIEIWITTKIEPNTVSWSKFFKVDIKRVVDSHYLSDFNSSSFFIDKEKKVVIVCGTSKYCNTYNFYTSYVVGEDGYLEATDFEDVKDVFYYVPSSVQIQ